MKNKVMSMYNQHMNHSKNHGKDKYHQQCGFHFGDKVQSGVSIAEQTAESYHVRDMRTDEVLSANFSSTDEAVDFVRKIPDRWCGIFTDKGICLMK